MISEIREEVAQQHNEYEGKEHRAKIGQRQTHSPFHAPVALPYGKHTTAVQHHSAEDGRTKADHES